jgi:actin-related protein
MLCVNGAVSMLRQTIEKGAPRIRMCELYGAVVLAGAGGGVAGLRQRMESELRSIRSDPTMPRTLRPQLIETRAARAAGHDLIRHIGVDADGDGTSTWPLTDAEALAWQGAAHSACVHMGRSKQGVFSSNDPEWIHADQHRCEPMSATRKAMRLAGAPSE